MKDNNYSEADIHKFILSKMTQSEMQKFEAAMKENPDFALEVEKQMKIAEGIAHFGTQKFKSRLKDIYTKVRPEIISKTEPPRSNISNINIGLAVLAALFLLFFLYRFLFVTPDIEPQEIYAQYFKTYDWNPILRSNESTIELEKAVDLYTSESYQEAVPLIEEVLKKYPNNIQARLAIANCYFNNDNPQLAVPHLEHVLTLDDVLYPDQANWYLVLADIKLDQLNDAKVKLNKLARNSNSDYYDLSKELLLKLK